MRTVEQTTREETRGRIQRQSTALVLVAMNRSTCLTVKRCAHKKDCECIYFLLPCPSVSACKQASKQNKLRRPLPATSSLACWSWEAGGRMEMMDDVAVRVVVRFSRVADRRDSSRFGLGLRLSFTWCANLTLGYGRHTSIKSNGDTKLNWP